MKSAMSAISVHLPTALARTSQKIAAQLHVSRAEFIRIAIEHEIERWKVKQEQAAMAKSFAAMRTHKSYLKDAEDIMNGLGSPLEDESEEWWKKE